MAYDSSNIDNFRYVTKEELHRGMLKFSLFLYNNPFLSRETVNDILSEFENFISNMFIPFIQTQLKNELKPLTNDNTYYTTQFILEKNKNVFNKFSTEHLRFKIYEQESFYVPPQIFPIGEDAVFVVNEDGVTEIQMKPIYAAKVSLQDTIKNIFSLPGVFKQIKDYTTVLNKEKILLSNFIQGDLWLKKYKRNDQFVVPVFLYFDEFETRNPLGSHAGEEKLGGVYLSLATLPPHLVAKLHNIFLLTICHSKYIKKFGNEKIFATTIEDLNILSEKGIKINIDGEEQTIYFDCGLVLGDNLGLNTICGFSESFSAHRYCRVCSATKDQCQSMTIEYPSLVRTVQSYELDISRAQFKETGLKERCIFNELHNFHISENISLDVMHDLSEGIASYTIGKILQTLIGEKLLSLKTVNDRIDKFHYGELEKGNKPRPLYFSHAKGGQKLKIKQSSSEVLCLTRYLGLMIGDLIPAANSYWKLYRYLRKIVGIITSPTLTRGQISNVKELIQKHNNMYFEKFGKLKPKMHLWLHYTRVMLLNGPVIHYSSMKFERKNKKLKEMAVATTSNINLPLTIAIRHQLQLCYITEFCQENMQTDIILGPIKAYNASRILKTILPAFKTNGTVHTLKYIKIIGKKFTVGTTCITKINEDGPRFGKIKDIFLYDDMHTYFQVQQYDTLYFNHYYHAYNVVSNISKSDILINVELVPKLPPSLYLIKNGEEFVATRYDI